jgi:glycosyltransferase involved in cell wall biosynthesis
VKVSVVATVLNEVHTIERLLDSLVRQSRLPDEIIILDGGSTDGTVEYLRRRRKQEALLRVLVFSGLNIAAGRNKAIEASRCELIACIDAGAWATENWLSELLLAFERDPSVDVVAGSFRADPANEFETALGATTLPVPEEVEPEKFLPSSRSVAFKKSAWRSAGGYPEWIDYCEDLIFDLELKRQGFRFAYAREAEVRFRPRPSVGAYFRQYYLYARGDGKADLWFKRHAIRYLTYVTASIAVILGLQNRLLWLVLLIAGMLYIRRPILRLCQMTEGWPVERRLRALLMLPYLRLVGDIAKMAGYPAGVRWRLRRRKSGFR